MDRWGNTSAKLDRPFKYIKAGMSNWQPAGRMRLFCLFCVAQIGIFIMEQFNQLAYFFYLS